MPSGHVFNRIRGSFGTRPNRTSPLRADIQGLRMLAVVAVILDHLLHWPSGGFVGVDVFFVISGFLITGILIKRHEETGKISFVWFYRRRIKRIIPAATITLAITVAAGYGVFNQARATQTFWDGVWAFLFSANWHFAAAGTDYFQASGPVSPLQHFWSLSVEEQFYFVWPAVMLGVLALAALRKGDLRRRTVTGIVMALIVIGTFVWAMYESVTSPTVAYFSTFTRAWELGFGALIAIVTPWWSKIANGLRPVLGWIGFLGILVSYFVINDGMTFPAPWAALPVLATALVIVAGTGGKQRFMFPLTNPVSGYIGDISYSLYLWHFPVIVLGTALIPDPLIANLVAVVLMLILSVLSYHLIEVPIQRSPLLERQQGRTREVRRFAARDAWRDWVNKYKTTYMFGGLGAVVTLVLVLGGLNYLSFRPVAHADQPIVALPSETPTPGQTPQYGPEVTAVQADLAKAVSLSSWPQTDPTLDYVVANDMIPSGAGPCGGLTPPSQDECTFGDKEAPNTAVLLGDSVAMAWLPALLPTYGSGDWKIVIKAMYGCPFVDLQKKDEQDKMNECVRRKADIAASVADLKPQLLIVSDTYVLPELASGGTPTADEWGAALGTMLGKVTPSASQTIVLTPPPAQKDVRSCYTPQSTPSDCMSVRTNAWKSVGAAEKAAAEKAGARWIDTSALFCVDGRCPATTETLPIKRDLTHVTMPYAQHIAPALAETIAAAPQG
jgi:peptidoglycan/LPS O-acetylase OafA/YrhL